MIDFIGIENFTKLTTVGQEVMGFPNLFDSRDSLVEFGGRVCYKSIDKMGYSKNFIESRMNEGHYDIAEHFWIVVKFQETNKNISVIKEFLYNVLEKIPHIKTAIDENGIFYIAGNGRTWQDFIKVFGWYFGEDDMDQIRFCAPKTLGFKLGENKGLTDLNFLENYSQVYNSARVENKYGQEVVLMGLMPPSENSKKFASATFYIKGISRSLTHQMVRHRLLSFSQESQRYVSLEKGEWGYIIPDDIYSNPDLFLKYDEWWANTKEFYEGLRNAKIKKEDARFVLPNAIETSLLVTGGLDGWKHFFKLRCAKDAQWEIRALAEMMRDLLGEHIEENILKG